MGLWSMLKFGDEAADAAKGVDDAADATKGLDDAADATKSVDETTDGLTKVEADTYRRQLLSNLGQRGIEQPGRMADAATSNLSDTAKYAGGTTVGLGGLYVGNEVRKSWERSNLAESKEQTYKEYMEARDEVMENDNLTPQQREERLQALKEAYEQAQANDGSGASNPISKFISDTFGGLGTIEKVSLLIAILIVYKVATGGDN